jgi:hypothetical protein
LSPPAGVLSNLGAAISFADACATIGLRGHELLDQLELLNQNLLQFDLKSM